ncbi:unnamed protein product [Boreogadus saida]
MQAASYCFLKSIWLYAGGFILLPQEHLALCRRLHTASSRASGSMQAASYCFLKSIWLYAGGFILLPQEHLLLKQSTKLCCQAAALDAVFSGFPFVDVQEDFSLQHRAIGQPV